MNDKRDYGDIIDLPRPVSARHKPMDRIARAAQFSPFAALSGYGWMIREEGRLTSVRPEPGEEERALLNQKLSILLECQAAHPAVTVFYFRPDPEKPGGAVVSISGTLRDLNEAKGTLTFTTGESVALSDLVDLQGELFFTLEGDSRDGV